MSIKNIQYVIFLESMMVNLLRNRSFPSFFAVIKRKKNERALSPALLGKFRFIAFKKPLGNTLFRILAHIFACFISTYTVGIKGITGYNHQCADKEFIFHGLLLFVKLFLVKAILLQQRGEEPPKVSQALLLLEAYTHF